MSVFASLAESLSRYWLAYGGTRALLSSGYFYLAAALTAACWSMWSTGGWWNVVLTIIPSLLGFTIAVYAIFLTISGPRYMAVMSDPELGSNGQSPFMGFATTFLHFAIVQIAALLVAILARAAAATPAPTAAIEALSDALRAPLWGLGFLIFAYALWLALATVLELYRLARIYDASMRLPPPS